MNDRFYREEEIETKLDHLGSGEDLPQPKPEPGLYCDGVA